MNKAKSCAVAALMLSSAICVPTTQSGVGAADAQRPAVESAVWRGKVREFARAHFKHPAWGFSHCVRDYALARELAEKDGAAVDDDVLFAAAFMHDIAAFPQWESAVADHSDKGAEAAAPILIEMGFPTSKISAVQAAIRTHMYYRKPIGAEAMYLHDADALDWLGAIGLARVIALAGSGDAPDTAATIQNIEDDLSKVPPTVVSKAGRARLPERIAQTRTFLRDLRAQTDDLKAL